MYSGAHHRLPPLTAVANGASRPEATGSQQAAEGRAQSRVPEPDWSILMARAQSGDGDAYRRLLEEITPYLRSLASKRHRAPSDVEDAVQDILLTVHAIRHTYDPRRPFGPWLVAIANRRIIDRLRRESRLRSRETPLDAGHETFPAAPANLHEAALEGRILRAAVELLPAGQRQAIKLMKLREMSLKEAAAASGMSVASLKVATHRALKSLRRILGSRGDQP